MAGFEESLRSFAIKKMQELKEKEGEKNVSKEDQKSTTGMPGKDQGVSKSSAEMAEIKIKPKSRNSHSRKESRSTEPKTQETNAKLTQDSETKTKTEKDAEQKSDAVKTEPAGSNKDVKEKKIMIKLLTKKIEPELPQQKNEEDAESSEQKSGAVKTEPAGSNKDVKEKKIMIKLLTKKIEPELPQQKNEEDAESSEQKSGAVKTEPAGSNKDVKEKKIMIKLLTKKIEPEPPQQKKSGEDAESSEDWDSSSDSSDSNDDDDDEPAADDTKPWRKVYEEGELSSSTQSEEGEEGEGAEPAVEKEGEVESDTSGEIKDEDSKKSKKHKKHKHKHKKHKHAGKDVVLEKEVTKDAKEKQGEKEIDKKEKKKSHKHKTKNKEKDVEDKAASKDKKKSTDVKNEKESSGKSKTDGHEKEPETAKHEKKSDKKEGKEGKDKKHKSKHKEKENDKGEKNKSSKRKHKSDSRSRSRSPSKSKSSSHKKRKHSRSQSRSPKSRRHSISTERLHSTDMRHRLNRSPMRYYSKHDRRDLSSRYRRRSRSRSRSPISDGEFKIDKVKLLEIAKANAYAKMQSGEFPPYMKLTPKSVVTKVDSGKGRSVQELTAVCKEISSKQLDYSDSDDSPVNKPFGSDDEPDEPFIRHPFKVREAPLGNVGIVMNIKNAVQKPIQDKEMLRITFPVSSGSQHRIKEDEMGTKPYGDWVSVEKKPKMMDPAAKPMAKMLLTPGMATLTSVAPLDAAAAAAAAATVAAMAPGAPAPTTVTDALVVPSVTGTVVAPTDAAAAVAAAAAAFIAMPPPPAPPPPPTTATTQPTTTSTNTTAVPTPTPTPQAIPPAVPLTFAGIISPAGMLPTSSPIAAASTIPAAVAAAEFAAATAAAAVSQAMAAMAAPPAVTIGVAATPPAVQKTVPKDDKVFEEVPDQKVDIAAMVSARLKAARRLESNPNDVEALSVMHKAQRQIRNWTMGKQKPGMFTGNTGLRPLRPDELANTDPRAQAWAKRDMFHNQAPIRGGNKGAMLMAKMGWRQGEGLGKNNEGALEPLALDVKMDRKGLVAGNEQLRKKNQLPKVICKDLSGKHPVSALMEICNKRKWPPPSFDLVADTGPAHKKHFVFKVRINNEEFQPAVSCPNKKQAKAQAATVALQKMGLIPADHVF